METIAQKSGNGSFKIERANASIFISIEGGSPRKFNNERAAYDWCVASYADLQGTMRGYSYLNAAYELEDLMGAN